MLLRRFNFRLLKYSEHKSWPNDPENVVSESDDFFYRQKVDTGKAVRTRGVQIVRPARTKSEIFSLMRSGRTGRKDSQYCEFIACDWRNKRVANISSDPSATTNYVEASKNSLPFETSPVFFRPEVLLRYKADRDKYTINEEHRSISCRGGWELRTYDINEAGQVHTYICYLGNLPHQEQQYWQSFNEEPKAGISNRAHLNDFEAKVTEDPAPLEAILGILRQWNGYDAEWWKLVDPLALKRVNTPRTQSRDEWAQAFVDLSKLVIEGLQVRALRARLKGMGIEFDKEEKSLALMERFLIGRGAIEVGANLDGLRDGATDSLQISVAPWWQ